MADPDEPLDHDKAIAALNKALRLQWRSGLAHTLVAGALTGFAHVALGPQLHGFAAAELDDARRLVEKIIALGGDAESEAGPAFGGCPSTVSST